MKKLLTLITLLLWTAAALFSQTTPQSFKYQGVARNGNNLVIGGIGIQLTIRQGSPTGVIAYQERLFPNTNDYGVFSVEVGAGTTIQGDFTAINWSSGAYYLQVELDPNGGANYTDMGTSQILSVPYALFAEKARVAENDADGDPVNEIQTLELAGTDLSILPNGNTVSLSGLASVWDANVNGIDYSSGNVGIGLNAPMAKLHVQQDLFQPDGVINGTYKGSTTEDGIGVVGTSVPADYFGIGGSFTGGWIGVEAQVFPTGNESYYGIIGSVNGGEGVNYGVFGAANGAGTNHAGYFSGNVTVTSNLDVFNNVEAWNLNSSNNTDVGGDLFVADFSQFGGSSGERTNIQNNGIVRMYGTSSENIYCGFPVIADLPYNNNGFIAVMDNQGAIQAGMYVNAQGNGDIFADVMSATTISANVKNFRMDHPQDESKEIWYACIEGPEAGAYDRGTATLSGGEATVKFSEHFQLVSNPSTMTVILTPLSAESKGLAVIEKNPDGFTVRELMNGNGSYSFDWEVKCVRKGYEDYKVVREKSKAPMIAPVPDKALQEGNTRPEREPTHVDPKMKQ